MSGRTRCALLWAAAGLLACGCERHDPSPAPKPATLTRTLPHTAAPQQAEPPRIVTVVHTVAPGETLWDIAHENGLSTRQVMEQNRLTADDARRLRPGTKLTLRGVGQPGAAAAHAAQPKPLPPLNDGAYHILQPRESLWTLAHLYDVSIEAIMARNGFSEDINGQLQIGQPIIIPGIEPSQIKRVQRSVRRTRRGQGFMHTVVRGETVWDLARTFKVSVGELMAANGLSVEAIQNIREGQQLFLPGVEDDGRGHVRRTPGARERRAQAVAERLGLGTLHAAGLLLHGRIEPRWIAAAGGKGRLPGTLRWPVTNGWFVRGFGSGQGGYHKAMDIMGKIGWNVRAAADGIVGYSGDKVSGFGNMIMVVHPGGWVTLYGHNSVNFVTAGERVRRGSVLAEVGSTGRSTGPHVHFELIYDGKNCDPAPLLRPGVRHRSGKFSSIAYTTWRLPNERPRSVQCAIRQKHPMPVVNEDPLSGAPQDEGETRDTPVPEDDSGP